MQYQTNTLEHLWMPFTANRDFKAEPRLLVRSDGMYYWNHRGDRIIDSTAGLFCCAAGHGRKEIVDAVTAQLMELDFASSFQVGHPAAFEMARRVTALAPDHMNYVFFVNSGSEAIDTALKIAMVYHRARGEGQRIRCVGRERAYHGVNIGGMSVGGIPNNHRAFGAKMQGVLHLRHTWLPEKNAFAKGQPEHGVELAEDLQRFVTLYGADTIACCIVEPIAGGTGVLPPPKGYLERLRQICDDNGILLIFDEVICGFGRTGKAFGAQSFNVMPDIMTVAKALTNAVIPMGGVIVSDEVYDTIANAAPEKGIEFFHGYTYSGHPAACAAGIATLEIYEREKLFDKAAALSDYFLDAVFSLREFPLVTDIRGYGMLAAFDLAPDGAPGARGYELTKRLFEAGVHMRVIGDSGLLSPPLIAEKEHVDEILRIVLDVLKSF
jgi:beta-alanine--pyruvate transaminase